MILFTDRMNYEMLFKEYCKKEGILDCPMNFIAWMQSEPEGKRLILRLYADLVEDIVVTKGG